jgi:hypothetical protein
MNSRTTINITKQVRRQIEKLGDLHEETYNDILERVLREHRSKK